METEKETTEKVELHFTGTLEASLTIIIFKIHVNWFVFKEILCTAYMSLLTNSLALNYLVLINCAMKIYLLIQITCICKARFVDTGNISY